MRDLNTDRHRGQFPIAIVATGNDHLLAFPGITIKYLNVIHLATLQ